MQEMVCLKSMLIHLNPDKIYIHSNVYEMGGSKGYWSKLFAGKKPFLVAKIPLREIRLRCVN
jgi:hypothetical protein